MKKKNIYERDWDDSEPLATDVAFLLFHSVAPNYAFVDDLNKLYGLALRRTDDIARGERSWPLFIYHDPLLHLSLMAQYFPPREGLPVPLDRPLRADEYRAVTDHADSLGFCRGWQQELEAQTNYRPDFARTDNPFEP